MLTLSVPLPELGSSFFFVSNGIITIVINGAENHYKERWILLECWCFDSLILRFNYLILEITNKRESVLLCVRWHVRGLEVW